MLVYTLAKDTLLQTMILPSSLACLSQTKASSCKASQGFLLSKTHDQYLIFNRLGAITIQNSMATHAILGENLINIKEAWLHDQHHLHANPHVDGVEHMPHKIRRLHKLNILA